MFAVWGVFAVGGILIVGTVCSVRVFVAELFGFLWCL